MAIRSIVVDLIARTSSFTPELDKASRALNKRAAEMNRSLQSVERGIGNLKGAFATFAGVIALDALVAAGARALDYASSLGEVSQQLGVTIKDLQVYRYIASQVGLSQEEIDASLQKLTRTAGEAAAGSKSQAKAFADLGIAVTDTNGRVKTASELMPAVADGLARIQDPARRAAIEVDLFGRAGQNLDPLLSQGSRAIKEMEDRAAGLGIILSDDLAKGADDAADKMAELKMILEARIASAVAENANSIYTLVDALANLVSWAGKAAQAWRLFKLEQTARLAEGKANGWLTGLLMSPEEKLRLRQEAQAARQQIYDIVVEGPRRAGLGSAGVLLQAGRDALGRPASSGRVTVPRTGTGSGGAAGARKAADDAARAAERAAEAAKRQADEYERALSGIRESLEVDRLRADGLNFSADLQEQINGLTERYGDLGKARLDTLIQETLQATAQRDKWKEIADIVGKLGDVEIAIGGDLSAGLDQLGDSAGKATEAIFSASPAWQEFRDGAGQAFQRTSQGLADAVLGFTSLGDVVRSLVSELASMALQAFVFKPLMAGLGLPGFSSGGFTGNMATGAVAGLVHGQEYVFDANATKRIGRANLDALRAGNFAGLARAAGNLRPANDGGPSIGKVEMHFPNVRNARDARETRDQYASGLRRTLADASRKGF